MRASKIVEQTDKLQELFLIKSRGELIKGETDRLKSRFEKEFLNAGKRRNLDLILSYQKRQSTYRKEWISARCRLDWLVRYIPSLNLMLI